MKMLFDGTLLKDEDEVPPIAATEIGRNAAGTAARLVGAVVTGKKIMVSEPERARRLAICASCEFFVNRRCLKCGCYMRFKARLETEHCPIKKW